MPPPACSHAIALFDNRLQQKQLPSYSSIRAVPYWYRALALNQWHVDISGDEELHVGHPEHGYTSFSLGISASSRGASWCKLRFLSHLVRQMTHDECSGARWLLYLDSDAALISNRSFAKHLRELQVDAGNAHLVLTREDSLPDRGFKTTHRLNTGVMAVRASAWAAHFLEEWYAKSATTCSDLRAIMPGEQGCLERHLLDMEGAGLPEGARHRVRILPMLPLNSPWGDAVRHLWSAAWAQRGAPHKHTGVDTFSDELHARNVGISQLNDLLVRALGRTREFMCNQSCSFAGAVTTRSSKGEVNRARMQAKQELVHAHANSTEAYA
jgi:hypothetical protein